VAAVLLLTGASSASASCGDYVHVRGKSGSPTAEQAADTMPGHPPADSPCSRGECNRPSDHSPAPTPPAPTGPTATDAALAAVVAIQPALGRPGWDDPSELPTSTPSSVFHPPRA
jgi:hypothetical protein